MPTAGFNPIPPQIAAAIAAKQNAAETPVPVDIIKSDERITRLPVEERHAQRVRYPVEVVAIQDDGTVTFQTPRGEITVKIDDPAVLEALRQSVETSSRSADHAIIIEHTPETHAQNKESDQSQPLPSPSVRATLIFAETPNPNVSEQTETQTQLNTSSATDVRITIPSTVSTLQTPDETAAITSSSPTPFLESAQQNSIDNYISTDVRITEISTHKVSEIIHTPLLDIQNTAITPLNYPLNLNIKNNVQTSLTANLIQIAEQSFNIPYPAPIAHIINVQPPPALTNNGVSENTPPVITSQLSLIVPTVIHTAPHTPQSPLNVSAPQPTPFLTTKNVVIESVHLASTRITSPLNDTISLENITKNITEFLHPISKTLSFENSIVQPRAHHTIAHVIGQTEQGNPIIATSPPETPIQTTGIPSPESPQSKTIPRFFVIHTPFESIPVGTQITITPTETVFNVSTPVTNNTVSQSFIPFTSYTTPQPWPVMNDIQQGLQQAIAAQTQSVSLAIPTPGSSAVSASQMAPAALFFLAAMRSGDMQSWLGKKAVELLQKTGKDNALKQLSNEFSALSRLSGETSQDGWRVTAMPLMWQNEIHKLRIMYKNDSDGQDDALIHSNKPLRFVIDIAFDALGDVQLDALFKPERLDMIVRTHDTFPAHIKQTMRRIYTDALNHTAIGGELSFLPHTDGWVTVEQKLPDTHSVDV